MSKEDKDMGVVYVLTNPMMPGIVKIDMKHAQTLMHGCRNYKALAYRYRSLANMLVPFLPKNPIKS